MAKKRSRKTKGGRSAAAKSTPKKETRAEKQPKKSASVKNAKNTKSAKGTTKALARKQPNAVQRWISETRGELRKVTWPTREEAVQLTKVVLLVTFAMSAFLGLMDWLFNKLFGLLFGLFT